MSKALGQPVVKLFLSFLSPETVKHGRVGLGVSLGLNRGVLHQIGSVSYWLHQCFFWSLRTKLGREKGSVQKEENHLQNKELWMPSPSPAPTPSPGSSCAPATFSSQLSYYLIITQQFCLVCTWLKGFCFCLRPKGYMWSQVCLLPALHQLIK